MRRVIAEEHQLLKDYIPRHGLSGVISDHRYGLWSDRCPTVLLCHQLQLRSPLPGQLGAGWVYRLHRRFLRRFEALWIPDHPGSDGLGGSLSHPPSLWGGVEYVGPLSRFADQPQPEAYQWPALQGQRPGILAVLSGPEPQRSLLETRLRQQAHTVDQPFWLVQGQPGAQTLRRAGNLWEISFLDGPDLMRALQQAETVISRSGYSSLMDYAALGLSRLILVPTPGQTEQTYLGQRMAAQGVALTVPQRHLLLREALGRLTACQGFSSPLPTGARLAPVLDAWLAKLNPPPDKMRSLKIHK
ncbi:MAG: hypothetical protein D6722_20915 [Bacteroidetes bacterium]|nr:MAG: hypothetical protein D6722_20915 [Bacteroidota bacterium]